MKKVISMVLVFLMLGSLTAFADDGYVYTNDGNLYSLEKEKFITDGVKECQESSLQLYILKDNGTLWVKQGKDDLFYITDSVKEFKVLGSTYAVKKIDGSLWMGEYNMTDMRFVMDNVKEVLLSNNATMCLSNDNKLYAWGLKGFMGVGDIKEESEAYLRIAEPTLVMENVEKIWNNGGRYFASKTDGSLWAWGRNMAYYKPAGMGMEPYTIRHLLGIGDEYKDVSVQCEPVRVAIDWVDELYFYNAYHMVAITKNDDLYYWGAHLPWGSEPYSATFKHTSVPVKTLENVKEIKGRSVITNDNALYWAFWHGGKVFENVKSVDGNILLTDDGTVYRWNYRPLVVPEIDLILIAENVKEFLDTDTNGNVLCLCDDTTLVEIDAKTFEKKSIAANVKEAFYFSNKVYFIDNGYALYKATDTGFDKMLDNAVREIRPISMTVNGEKVEMDVDPYIKNDRTMVPMRAIFEALGASVSWDDETKTAIGVKGGLEIKIAIGGNMLYKNGEEVALDCAAEIKNGRTMVPVRAISEAFDYIVEWDNETKTVNILEPYNRLYYIYDEEGNVAGAKVGTGNYIHYEYLYDENGNVVRVWEKQMIKNSDRLFEYTYNEKGQRISKSVCNEWWKEALYGGPIDKDVTFTEVERYFYDEEGQLLYAEYPSGGRIRDYIYDEEGRLIGEESSLGNITRYFYDEEGKVEYREDY